MRGQVLFIGALVVFSLTVEPAYASDRGALGVTLSNEQPANSHGVAVTGVWAGSPAAHADIQPADRILGIDGQKVANYHDVMRLVGSKPPGSQLKLDIARGAWRTTKSVYLGHSQQVFQQSPAINTWSMRPSTPVGATPAWQPLWDYPRPGQTWYPPDRWQTHPHNDILTSLYNSDF